MHDAKKCGGRNAAGEARDLTGLKIDDHRVPKTFCHKSNPVIVGGKVSAFAESSQYADIG